MKDVDKKVYALWPDIEEMARDLNESPHALAMLKKARMLPAVIHDDNIVIRAIYMGSKLKRLDLRDHRIRRALSGT